MSLNELLPVILNPPWCHDVVLPPAILRARCEDFDVEEIPTYLPDGQGEHLFLWIEKRDLPAGELLTRLARSLGVSSRDIGVAGQKDRRAVTRQFVSVPRSCESRLSNIDDDRIRILAVSAHGNKLRTGHLIGNRFRIVLRSSSDEGFTPAHSEATNARLTELAESGFPNYFGPQRFGHEGRTALDGVAFLRGELTARHWKPQQRRFMSKLAASAAQSAVFNLTLAARVTAGTFVTPQSGDVVCGRTGIRPFLFDERGNTAAEDVIPMGPMPGPKMVTATGDVLQAESEVLNQLELSQDDFLRHAKLTSGTRRRYVEYPSAVGAELTDDGAICVRFELSSGSFATVLLAELTSV